MNGEVLPIEQLRKRIRQAIEDREEWERQNFIYRMNRADSIARVFDGFAVGFLYVLILGAFIGGYETETEQVARNWIAVLMILAWFIARALPRYEEAREL